ncbi:MAG: aldo/keto reductase [Planctomycetes bacterium]|nr:aldo/keto reductase [Planctomycetota bacterium]
MVPETPSAPAAAARASRLGLGTAQFGSAYGLANRGGRVTPERVRAILLAANAAGAAVLDTAPAYGDAEQVLGDLGAASAAFAVVTKTAVGAGPAAVRAQLLRSLARLGRPVADALLVHDRRELLADDGPALWAALEAVRDEGLARRIGVSVYHPDEALRLARRLPLQIVQLPLNVLDQRAVRSGALAELAARGVEVHVRSVFLQGLLLMPKTAIPPALAVAAPAVAAFQACAREHGLTPLAAALGFVLAVPGVRVAICGVDSLEQLQELLAAAADTVDPAGFAALATENLDIVDPSRWR